MPLLVWDAEQYSVQVDTFDTQHRQLFGLINHLHNAMRAGESRTVICDVLADLRRYTVQHFTAEEDAMRKAGHSGLPVHRLEHKKFTMQVEDFLEKYKRGNALLTMDVMTFLQEWLRKHILTTDRGYSQDLKAMRN